MSNYFEIVRIVVENPNLSGRIKLKKGLSDFKEDLLVMIILNLILVGIWIVIPTTLSFAEFMYTMIFMLIMLNTIRFFYLQFGNVRNIVVTEKHISDTYGNKLIVIIPESSLSVINYGEVQFRGLNVESEVMNSSPADFFVELGIAILELFSKRFLPFIKPNTDYYQFSLAHPTEGTLKLFHLRTNDHQGMKRLIEIIANMTKLPVNFDKIKA